MTIKSQGAYYDSDSDRVYSFLSNGTNSYLVYTDKDAVEWHYAEGSSTASAIAFGITQNAWFDKYGSQIIFTKGETRGNEGIMTTSGGLFILNASGQIILYGAKNNPTGKVLEIHKERICVGNITALSGIAQNGESWTIMSKFLPESSDSIASISTSGIVFGSVTSRVMVSGQGSIFNVGDRVYISGTVLSGINNVNQNFFNVAGVTSSQVIIEYENANGIGWLSGGDVVLRGPCWSPAIYNDATTGAGIFRCDDNENDAVIELESSFGALAILRQENPYIFTGSLESGDQTLARALNVKYGAYSPHTFLTAGGIWFVSQYGLSKIEGTTIKTNANALDNIVDITAIEPIRPTFEADISNKNNLILWGSNRYIYMHNSDEDKTYVLDTLKGNWFRWTGRLVDRFVNIGIETYSVYKHFLFKLNDGYRLFDMSTYDYAYMVSKYKTKITDQGSMLNPKIYELLYALIEGSVTTATINPLTFNVYYNGELTAKMSFSFDIKTGTIYTWNDLTTNATITWNTTTTTATQTWNEVIGIFVNMLEKRKYRLGSGRELQIEITHSDNSSFRISRILLNYELLDIT